MNEAHAITRARERYSVEMRIEDLVELNEQIVNGHALIVGTDYSTGGKVMIVKYGDVAMRCVACPVSGVIFTFLPPVGKLRRPNVSTYDPQHRRMFVTNKQKRKQRLKSMNKSC